MTTNPASAQKQDDASSSTTTGWKDKACRVCDSFSFFKKSMSSRADGAHTETNVEHPPPARRQPGASHADADDSASSPAWTTPDDQLPCPPDYTDLGNSAWAFLHTVASYYPEQPEAQVCCGGVPVLVWNEMKNTIHLYKKQHTIPPHTFPHTIPPPVPPPNPPPGAIRSPAAHQRSRPPLPMHQLCRAPTGGASHQPPSCGEPQRLGTVDVSVAQFGQRSVGKAHV